MNNVKTTTWDAAEHLKDDADVAAYVEAALEDGDHHVVAAALGDVARAKGMTQVARDAGLGRESLYKSLSPDGNPEFSTVMRVLEGAWVSGCGPRLRTTAVRTVGQGLRHLRRRMRARYSTSDGDARH